MLLLPYLLYNNKYIIYKSSLTSNTRINVSDDLSFLFISFAMYNTYIAFVQNGDSNEAEIDKRNVAAPYISQAGPANARHYFLVVENFIYVEVDEPPFKLWLLLSDSIMCTTLCIQNNGTNVCCSSKRSYSVLHLVQVSVLYQLR